MAAKSRHATDHRGLVLEAVATSPEPPTIDSIRRDSICEGFDAVRVGKMVRQLRVEGLLGLQDGGSPATFFITAAGLDYLTHGRFDRGLPREHTRPAARKKRGPQK